MNDQKVIAIIPARGGSKGIPHKNLLKIAGKPLVAWSIEQARKASLVGCVYVSTDDANIAKVSEEFGAMVIYRPTELAADKSPSEDALIHAVDWVESEQATLVETIVFLQATSPLREDGDIDAAVRKFQKLGADSLFSCSVLEDHFLWKKINGQYVSTNYDYRDRKPRQQICPSYLENGSIYVFKPEQLRQNRNRLGGKIEIYEMNSWKSIQIDNPDDMKLCEYYLKVKLLNEA